MHHKFRVLLAVLILLLAGLACESFADYLCDYTDQGVCGPRVDDSEWEEMRSQEEFEADQAEFLDEPAGTQHVELEMASPEECNARQSLDVAVSAPDVKDNDNENRCKYTVTYTNTGDQRIWVFVHKTKKSMESEAEEIWKNYYSLDPRESLEMGYQTLIYKQSGTYSIDVVTDVAPIFATEACKNTFRNDVEPRQQIGYPIEVPCD